MTKKYKPQISEKEKKKRDRLRLIEAFEKSVLYNHCRLKEEEIEKLPIEERQKMVESVLDKWLMERYGLDSFIKMGIRNLSYSNKLNKFLPRQSVAKKQASPPNTVKPAGNKSTSRRASGWNWWGHY